MTIPELMGQLNDQPYCELDFGILTANDDTPEIVGCRWDIKHGLTI